MRAAALVPAVRAPPELRTITPDSWVVTVSDDDADARDSAVLRPSRFVVVGAPGRSRRGASASSSSLRPCGADASSDVGDGTVGFDSDTVELEEADDEPSSAHATPGVVAIAPLTPSASARAPTRPMYLAYAVGGAGLDGSEREFSEFAVGRVAVGPSRLFSRGGHAIGASDGGGQSRPAACFQLRLVDFASFTTTPRSSEIDAKINVRCAVCTQMPPKISTSAKRISKCLWQDLFGSIEEIAQSKRTAM